MANEVKIKPIREWQEKEGKRLLPTIRLYLGNWHIATVCPTNADPELYHFDCMTDILMNIQSKQTLEDIKLDIELTLKEFIKKITIKNLSVKGEPKPIK
jgi:hypothetical protein